ncbi:MAG: SMI1/KNR4 family protein [Chloroflexi bacterium]|nr:SMI1/KNR4 family protein [Chloroflexota bacterium]OJW02786.1 MAG: hypothetical protein BGO39_06055 [Chloroflexi bacterium 54-19]
MDALIKQIKLQRVFNPPQFVSEKGSRPIPLPPPVTVEELDEAEKRMNLRLPELLRELYLYVGNGGFGPEYGILGITPAGWKDDFGDTAFSYYLKIIEPPIYNENYIGLLPICYYGCAEHIFLDCKSEDGRIILPNEDIESASLNLREWLEKWLNEGGTTFLLMEEFYEENGGPKHI